MKSCNFVGEFFNVYLSEETKFKKLSAEVDLFKSYLGFSDIELTHLGGINIISTC